MLLHLQSNNQRNAANALMMSFEKSISHLQACCHSTCNPIVTRLSDLSDTPTFLSPGSIAELKRDAFQAPADCDCHCFCAFISPTSFKWRPEDNFLNLQVDLCVR